MVARHGPESPSTGIRNQRAQSSTRQVKTALSRRLLAYWCQVSFRSFTVLGAYVQAGAVAGEVIFLALMRNASFHGWLSKRVLDRSQHT